MKTFFKWLGLVLLALVLVVLGSLGWLLGTQGGCRWLLHQVPGLAVEQFQGRLAGHWQAQQLSYQQPGLRLELDLLAMDWSPHCLWHLTVCVRKLHVQKVDVQTEASEQPSSSGPIQLPDIKLPVRVEVQQLQVGQFVLNGALQASDLELGARLLEDGLHIDELQVRRQDIELALMGQLQLSGHWPVQINAQLALPSQQDKSWLADLHLEGDVARQLHLQLASHGYLDGKLEAWASPLDERLPVRLSLDIDRFKALASLPDTLIVQDLHLAATGSLADGFKVQGKLSLPAKDKPAQLAVDGLIKATGANLDHLQLSTDDQHRLTLKTKVDWQKGLVATADLDWLDFPWQSLYPGVESPVVAHRLKAQLSYANNQYDGHLAADLGGPAGPFTLATPIKGDASQVELSGLKLVAGGGQLQGLLRVAFGDGIGWLAQLDLKQLNPGYWLEALPGKLNGHLASQGSLKNQQLQADAQVDIKGLLRHQPAALQLAAKGQGQHWQLPQLNLRLGSNQITGQGALADQLRGEFKLQLASLGQLWPELRGRANGQLKVAGTLQKPQGQLDLQGNGLGFEQQGTAQLDLRASLNGVGEARLDLQAKNIQAGGTALGDLQLQGHGDLHRQALELALKGPLLQTDLALNGTLDKGNWQGALARGQITAKGMEWRLRQPATINRRADGRITTGAHCWTHGEASLCLDQQQLTPDTHISAHLHDFALEELSPFMPADFAWQGQLNADVDLRLPTQGPTGVIKVNAGAGTLAMRSSGSWQKFPYQRLTLNARLAPRQVTGEVHFDADNLGYLQLSAAVDPSSAGKPLQGRFSLQGLDISLARPFVPMADQIKGQLNGAGTLGGSLQSPSIKGALHLSKGLIAGPDMPTELHDLHLDITVNDRTALVQGGWKAPGKGHAELSGKVAWEGEAPLVDVNLSGQQLPVSIKPYAELVVEPDLHLGMNGQHLELTGKVAVPRGLIEVKQLPASTVKVSEDVQVVGREQKKKSAQPMEMAMAVDVLVGKDALKLSAFGLNALIRGQLHIGDNLDTQGQLNLVDGRYRAYGQDLRLRKAHIQFTGPIAKPYLEVEAVRHNDDDDVTAGISMTGSPTDPDIQIFSDPEMSQDEALSYLLTGHSMDESSDTQNAVAKAALSMGLSSAAELAGKLGESLGLGNLALNTEGDGDDTSVVASGKISDRLTLDYDMGVFDSTASIGLRYRLTKRIFLKAVGGLNSSLDAFYHRDF